MKQAKEQGLCRPLCTLLVAGQTMLTFAAAEEHCTRCYRNTGRA